MTLTWHGFEDGVLYLKWEDEDGAPSRGSRLPGMDVSDLPAEVQAAVEAVWTPAFVQAWRDERYPAPTLDQLKTTKAEAVNVRREAAFAIGFEIPSGPAASQHMQLRNADDKANWLIAERGAKKAIEAGAGSAPIVPLRSTENITTLITPTAMVALLDGLDAWGRAVTAYSWGLKDQIAAANDQAALNAIDIDDGWPA